MKRRDFLIKSGVYSAGMIAGTSALGAMNYQGYGNDSIRLAVIGTGDRGGGMIPIIQKLDGIEVSACCDALPFRLDNGMKKAGKKAKGFTDYRAVLDRKDVDAVMIATPFSTHEKIAIDALDAGKHVYCEKTMAKSFSGIDNVLQKAHASKQIFQTGHQYHSSRLYAHVVDMIKSGEIGEVISFECQWNRQGNWRRHVPDPSLERAINWRMYREYSGGMAAELCSHQIDFIHWVLGENPKKVMGVGGIDYWKDGRETYDNIHLLFEYPGGVKAKFTCLTTNSLGDYQIKVHGQKGTIQLDYSKAWIYYEKAHEKSKGVVDGVSGATENPHTQGRAHAIDVSHMDPSAQAIVDFRQSILDNKTPLSNVDTGANTAKAVQLSLDAMMKEQIQYWKS